MAHITRWRANQPGHRMFFHIFRHIHAQYRAVIIKQKCRQCLGQFSFANTGRPQHQKTAHRLIRVSQSSTRPSGGICNRGNRLLLADDPLANMVFHCQQFVTLTFEHFINWNACPFADDLGNMLAGYRFIHHFSRRHSIFCRL